MQDPISDLIIRMKNASLMHKETVSVTASNIKIAILDVLLKEGFIKAFAKKGKKAVKFIEITLLYKDKTPKIQGVERVSKLSKRVYLGVQDIKPVKNGFGRLILSTPKGVLSDKEAKVAKVGGEALFKIW